MRGSHYRSAYAFAAASVAFVVPAGEARAEEDTAVQASMQCDRANEPGRVRCTVEARAEGGRTIAWADVEILALPELASALKGRIGPQDALAREPSSIKWALGLVARRAGQGEVRARVRVVLCEAPRRGTPASAPLCAPVIVAVQARIVVG